MHQSVPQKFHLDRLPERSDRIRGFVHGGKGIGIPPVSLHRHCRHRVQIYSEHPVRFSGVCLICCEDLRPWGQLLRHPSLHEREDFRLVLCRAADQSHAEEPGADPVRERAHIPCAVFLCLRARLHLLNDRRQCLDRLRAGVVFFLHDVSPCDLMNHTFVLPKFSLLPCSLPLSTVHGRYAPVPWFPLPLNISPARSPHIQAARLFRRYGR